MTTADTSGARPASERDTFCPSCADAAVALTHALSTERRLTEAYETLRRYEDEAREESKADAVIAVCAVVGVCAVVLAVLWLLGRLAVVIGGAL